MAGIEDYYELGLEHTRLHEGAGRLEWLRTMEIFERHAPPPPACILDVGGGAGAYSLPLARRGYAVHLIDPVSLHVEQARKAAKRQSSHPLASASVGDARELPLEDGSADAVLLLGPLYHLTEEADRMLALREALRVLRGGGLLLAAGISRFASTCDGLRQKSLLRPEFERIVERDLRDGQHRNDTNNPAWFTTAYFHHPAELSKEVIDTGFAFDALLSVEGPAWLVPNLDDWLATKASAQVLLRAIRRVEAEPSLIGASAHIMAVAHKPKCLASSHLFVGRRNPNASI